MKIREHTDLDVYKRAFDAAMLIFHATRNFPKEEILLANRSDPPIIKIGLRKSGRSVAQATL